MAVKNFFGHNRTEPDFDDLKDIFIRLFYYVPNTIYILDGFDALDQEHSKSILICFRSLFSSSKSPQGSQLLLLSREQIPGYVDIATFIPEIRQISTSPGVRQDIETYIEMSIIDKTMYRKLTEDALLLQEIKQKLLKESSGMYETSSSAF
jgi:hypothetical protein